MSKKTYKNFKVDERIAQRIHKVMGFDSEGKSLNALLKFMTSHYALMDEHTKCICINAAVNEKTEQITADLVDGKLDPIEHARMFDEILDKETDRIDKLFYVNLNDSWS